jgi:hypothetical protein
MYFHKISLMYRRNILPPSSGLKNKTMKQDAGIKQGELPVRVSDMSVNIYQTTRHYIPDDRTLRSVSCYPDSVQYLCFYFLCVNPVTRKPPILYCLHSHLVYFAFFAFLCVTIYLFYFFPFLRVFLLRTFYIHIYYVYF